MLSAQEVRSLRGQLYLVGGMILLCAIGAGVLASQRDWAETFLRERYSETGDDLKPIAKKVEDGSLTQEEFDALTQEHQIALYEHWIQLESTSEVGAKLLNRLGGHLYLPRLEKTIICGDSNQRERALEFLQWSDPSEAGTMLIRVAKWCRWRRLNELADQVDAARERI